VIDIVIKSYDDLGIMGESQVVTVTKGAPCANADSCAKGQKCEAGKCFWDQPSGKLGDSCDYEQFCESQQCVITDQGGYCSQDCVVGATDACPMGFDCVEAGASGACIPVEEGGCCSVGGDGPSAVWIHGSLSLFVIGLVVRRRRRRRDRL
jgi:MYXO-CTERM domain-containing protein